MTSHALSLPLLYAHLCVMIAQLVLGASLTSERGPSPQLVKVWYALVAGSMTTGALWLDLHRSTHAHRAWPWLYLSLSLCAWGWVEWRLTRQKTNVDDPNVDAPKRGER